MTKPRERAVRIGKLRTALEIAAEIGKVYRDARHGLLDSSVGYRLAGILSMMRTAVETAVFEARIAELEAQVARKSSISRFAPMSDPTRAVSEAEIVSDEGQTRRH